ncbi:hypothetical protein ACFLRT_03190 [Acidobacteriota bacterium]
MAEKKISNSKKSLKVLHSSENSKEAYKRLEIIPEVIYATLIALILFTLANQSVGPLANKPVFSIKFIALFLMGVFMVEECCNVILVNSIKPYGSSNRFTVDVLIASLFFFAFTAINNNRMVFVYFLAINHLLNFLWALSLQRSEMIESILSEYLKLTIWTNAVTFVVCTIIIILSRFFKAEFWFETTLICYLVVYVLLLFLPSIIFNFRLISLKQDTNEKGRDYPALGPGPILTKVTIYIILFVVHILKAIIEAVISFFRDLFEK